MSVKFKYTHIHVRSTDGPSWSSAEALSWQSGSTLTCHHNAAMDIASAKRPGMHVTYSKVQVQGPLHVRPECCYCMYRYFIAACSPLPQCLRYSKVEQAHG